MTENPRKSELPQFVQNAITDSNSLLFGPEEEALPLCDSCVFNRRNCPNEENVLVPIESPKGSKRIILVDAFESGL